MELLIISKYIFLFFIYSFAGWFLEVLYRSYNQKVFVNAGFINGPFVLIYGFGAMSLLFFEYFFKIPGVLFHIIIYFILLSSLEYFTGYLFELVFHLKLWDYSDQKLNLNGRISLLFSTVWTILALLFVYFIHPFVYEIITKINSSFILYFSGVLIVYFVVDYSYSLLQLTRFYDKVLFYRQYLFSNEKVQQTFDFSRRLIRAFPNLNNYIVSKINNRIKNTIGNSLEKIKDRINKGDYELIFEDEEFMNIASEIINNEEFQKLKKYPHHNSSIYEHVIKVAYISFKISKKFKLDYISTTRGALLHDFFLYDWRNHDVPDLPADKFHGPAHPKIALKNAEKNFKLNKVERDIIVKHMWPLTIIPPRYAESFVVTFADKYSASKEYLSKIKNKLINNKKSESSNDENIKL